MPSDLPGWMLALALAAMIGWFIPKALNAGRGALGWTAKVFAEAAAVAIVEKLGSRLAPSWLADFDEALEPIYQDISLIRAEVTSNQGTSLKDKVDITALYVHQMQQDIEPLLTEYKRRDVQPET